MITPWVAGTVENVSAAHGARATSAHPRPRRASDRGRSLPVVPHPLVVHRYGNPDAPPVVLVHGLTEAGTAWPDLVEHWGDAWDVHAPDLRGHGRSPRFTDDDLADTSGVMLRDLLALLDDVRRPVALVGHSMGGLLSLRAALGRPTSVWALVLEDPARPRGPVPHLEFAARNQAFLDTVTSQPDAEVDRMLRETTWSRAEVEAWAACKPLVDREYVRRGLALGDPAWEELFESLAVPTLLLAPPDSDMAPCDVRNPRVTTVVVPGAGHNLRRDQPARYQEAVDAFLVDAVPTTGHPGVG